MALSREARMSALLTASFLTPVDPPPPLVGTK
jgi:hypothetical protein